MVIGSFIFCLILFVFVGAASMWKKSDDNEDYLVAGRNVPPWLAALSAAATNNSGFMFIGLIGFAYVYGVEAVWLHSGWVSADVLAWIFVHKRLNRRSGALGAKSVPGILATGDDGMLSRPIALVAGLMTFVLLGAYAGAQLKAGSTTMYVLFDWDMRLGAVLGAAIVLIYSFSGGLRASIWTDAAQSFVMVISMSSIMYVCWSTVGSPMELFSELRAIDPTLVDWTPDGLQFGLGLYLLGWFFGGLGILGQPHILIRIMSIETPEKVPEARRFYFAWYIPFSIATLLVGLYSRVLLPDIASMVDAQGIVDPAELALPIMSMEFLPDILTGLTLAAIFAATMSTADSQIISCSAAVTQDIRPSWTENYTASKIATVTVTLSALAMAIFAGEGVFSLVLSAWSILGAAFGPILLIRVFGLALDWRLAIGMMVAGTITVILWSGSLYAGDIFKLLPGMLVPSVLYVVSQPIISRNIGYRTAVDRD